MNSIIETDYQRKLRTRNEAVRKRFRELMAVPGQRKTPVVKLLMEQFGINSNSTIYSIIKEEHYARH